MKNLKIILVLLSLLFFTCKRDTTPPEDICKYSKKWSDLIQITLNDSDSVTKATSLYNGQNLLVNSKPVRQSHTNEILGLRFTLSLDYSGIKDTTLTNETIIEIEYMLGKKDTIIINSIPKFDLCSICNNNIIYFRDTIKETKCKQEDIYF